MIVFIIIQSIGNFLVGILIVILSHTGNLVYNLEFYLILQFNTIYTLQRSHRDVEIN